MIKSAIFRCKLSGVNCLSTPELTELLLKVGEAIRTVHPDAQIDPSIEVEEIRPESQHTMLGKAAVDGYMKVQRAKDGSTEFYRNINGESHPITEDAYNKAHS